MVARYVQTNCHTSRYVLFPIFFVVVLAGSCTDVVLTQAQGQLNSPGYPMNYPRLTECQWTIKVLALLYLILAGNAKHV